MISLIVIFIVSFRTQIYIQKYVITANFFAEFNS